MADDKNEGDKPNPLQAKLDEEIQNAKKQRERAQTAEKALSALEAEVQKIKDDKTATDAAAEKAKLEGKGDYEKALKAQEESQKAALETATTRGDAAESMLKNLLGRDALKTSLATAGVKGELLGQAATLLANRVKVEFADGKSTVTVLDAEGSPMFTEGNPSTLEHLATSFTADNLHFKGPSGDGGSGAHRGSDGAKGTTYDEIVAAGGAEEYVAKHGQEAFNKLATAQPKKE